jgi:hypothetical protein
MKTKDKALVFAISNSLSKPEAISFAKTLDPNEKYYLVKVSENPKARHLAKREPYVITWNLRKNEIVQNGYELFVDKRYVATV